MLSRVPGGVSGPDPRSGEPRLRVGLEEVEEGRVTALTGTGA